MKRFGLRDRKTSAGKIITAALVGSAVGAAVGMLMAPASGQELRQKIKRTGESQARRLANQVREMKGAVSHHEPAGTIISEVEG
ncbi:MAG TPA: YtxH domain-containing protein [Anaerolineales bacterium]|nr:YtxH domain-containing protein [Anaerolineales bacterium]